MPLTTPLRRRDFRLLWAGLAVSLLGDGFFMVAGWPVPVLASLADAVPIRLLPIDAAAFPKLRQTHPFFRLAQVPVGTYKGVPATAAVGVGAVWVTSAALPDDLVYGVTKALWEKSTLHLLVLGHPEGRQIRLETALEGLAIPLHPGAERFYREAGLLH